ncbi:uncharacterized protein LOC129580945 [Paramacrobiotus metropolitanus]|uniref:uncharacterized protein LOC129580945 n=1 Tax=Paramacrobiotus metropolitanus TaxID=2943436 RepID=UPI002445BFA9|nr:uncharacterized protein LOC129580945 [Paramacrobiotus metropolitanus]
MHLYRDSSGAVQRLDLPTPATGKMLPAVPTRTSSLNPEFKPDKSRRSPTDLFERYLKSAYYPDANGITSSSTNLNANVNNVSGGADSLRHSFRAGLPGHRSRAGLSPAASAVVNNNNNVVNTAGMVRVNIPTSADHHVREARASSNSPPMYKIRARSNSFKENDKNGWITVGPEFSIKPAHGVQPVINVTILPTLKTSEPDYSGSGSGVVVVPERIISGTGGVNVQSLGSGHGRPPVLTAKNAIVSAPISNPHSMERDGLYQIYTPPLPPAAVPPHAALPPTPVEKEKPRLSTLLRRRNSSMSRAHTLQNSSQPFQRTYSMNLKSALKKRSSSQSYFEPKKSVTFADYTTVYS